MTTERDKTNGQANAAGDTLQAQRLLVSCEDLAEMLVGFGVRTIRRMDLEGRIPRPIPFGRYLRWDAAEIREWVTARCPDRDDWEAEREQRICTPARTSL